MNQVFNTPRTPSAREAAPESQSLHDAAWPDMFANLQAAYADLVHTQNELELRATQIDEIRDLFERVIESMSDAMFLMDSMGRLTRVNHSAILLLGHDEEALVGQPFSTLVGKGSIPATPMQVLAQDPSGVLANVESEIRRSDGRAVPVSVSCSLVRDKRGKITGVLVIARDITELMRIRLAEKELAQMKEDFVASISHELRTPLASIKGFVDLLLKGKVKEKAVEQEFLTRVVQEADRLMALVNDLLDISRMEAGRLQLDISDFDINELIGLTLESLQGVAEQKKIEIGYSPIRPNSRLQGDRRRLQQVLVNLVGNALKFSEPGTQIKLDGEVKEETMLIRVVDQGPGIPAESLPKLFDKFYQTHQRKKRAATGTGLGLYITKQIIETHGGRIEVESELDVGTTFTITLPLEAVIAGEM